MANLRWLLLGVTLTALAAGGVAWFAGAPTVADYCWLAGTVVAIVPAMWWVIAGLRAGRFGVDILDGLGSTEALHVFLSARPGACRAGTVGHPVPGYEVEIVDERGAPVAAGTPGALRVRGDSVAAGYWQRREATARAFGGKAQYEAAIKELEANIYELEVS